MSLLGLDGKPLGGHSKGLDIGKLAKPDYPLFDESLYPSPIKGLVLEADPDVGKPWEFVYITVYLENGEWHKDKVAKMLLTEVMDVVSQRGWMILTVGFMEKLMEEE